MLEKGGPDWGKRGSEGRGGEGKGGAIRGRGGPLEGRWMEGVRAQGTLGGGR